MSKQLILTGWGRSDYVAAAAVALKAIGEADVLGVSMRRLADVLEKESAGHEVVYVLGIGLERHPRLQHRKCKASHQAGRIGNLTNRGKTMLARLANRGKVPFLNLEFRDVLIQIQTCTSDLYKKLWYNTRRQPMKGVLC